jgi:hypothetical protein
MYQCIVGSVGEHEMDPLDGPIDHNRIRAEQIKIGVVTCHNGRSDLPKMFTFAANAETKNQITSFIADMIDVCKNQPHTKLVSVATDALDGPLMQDMFLKFLRQLNGPVPTIDANHVAKALRNQIVFGTTVKSNSTHVLDAALLLDTVPEYLHQVKDFASDRDVLRLCEAKCVERIIDADLVHLSMTSSASTYYQLTSQTNYHQRRSALKDYVMR